MMSHNGNNPDATRQSPVPVEQIPVPAATEAPFPASPSTDSNPNEGPKKFAIRADRKGSEEISKTKLVLLGGGLLAAVLFFVFTAVVEKAPKRPAGHAQTPQPSKPVNAPPQQFQGSVTPLMDTVHRSAPDNQSGQLSPADIRRTRSSENGGGSGSGNNSTHGFAKPAPGASLASVPSFGATQQKWEDPLPYNESPQSGETQTQQQNGLKAPSIIFVRSLAQTQLLAPSKPPSGDDSAPHLDLPPGTRIEAKLETQISSAVLAPVVAVVEYTYAIGDRIVVPAGARVYGQLAQADRSGFVSVKFEEIELLDGEREKIDAVGTDLNLGPIKGNVYGKNSGRNFLVRAASGLGSVLAEVAGNNTGAAFSENDLLREQLAENIGTAGDAEVLSLNANSRVVVSVPADTKIYVVFTKHEQAPSEFHKAATAVQ
jgi:type IV secretory pathway VirB10-like protein